VSTPIFFSQARLEALVESGVLELDGDALLLAGGRARYRVEEAVRILAEEVCAGEVPDLVGTVQLRQRLVDDLGGELLGSSLLLGEAAFEVVTGVLASPDGEMTSGPSEGDPRCWSSLKGPSGPRI
jgi:hypothetical protein